MNNKQIEIRRENGSDQARVEQDGKRVLKLGLDPIVDPDGKGLQTHWQKTACSLLTGCIAHVLYRALKENHPAILPSGD